ncbi:glycosyltransferase [Pseudomonas sp. St29]|nr:glycosyltransferase [Pseudomonas sp. St29]
MILKSQRAQPRPTAEAGQRAQSRSLERAQSKQKGDAMRRLFRFFSTQPGLHRISLPQGSITQGTQQIEAITEQQADGKADL